MTRSEPTASMQSQLHYTALAYHMAMTKTSAFKKNAIRLWRMSVLGLVELVLA